MDILEKIKEQFPNFSKGQRSIARFIAEHYDQAAYITASKLGDEVSVSESTVVRFAFELGYDGYPQMQKDLQELVRHTLTSVQRIEVAGTRIGETDILRKVMQADIEKLRLSLEEADSEAFESSVEAIVNASRIYIIGVRSSSALASFLYFYLNLMRENVFYVNSSTVSETFEQIMRIDSNDVVIGMSFPRYSRRTAQAMRFAKDRGASTIAITDSAKSPLAQTADMSLLALSDMASFVDSLVAPLSVINALIVAVGMRKKDDVKKTFNLLEQIWSDYHVYDTSFGPGKDKE